MRQILTSKSAPQPAIMKTPRGGRKMVIITMRIAETGFAIVDSCKLANVKQWVYLFFVDLK